MTEHVTNVASVPHRSPFRYPGGKTWLVPEVRRWVSSLSSRPKVFCEPFCGGAIAGLSVLFDELVDRLVLVELDEDVAAVWEAILNGSERSLVEMIDQFELSQESVREVMNGNNTSLLHRAFATIVRNRVQRGGILAPGASLMKAGENGRGIASRWYPRTLKARIEAISAKRDRITFVHGDGIAWMKQNAEQADAVFFIDPPYTLAGRRLYRYSEIDHEELFRVAATLRGDFLITYDDAQPVRELAATAGFETHVVSMKNTHHRIMSELLIGRDISWAGADPLEPVQDALFEAREAYRVSCD